MTSNSSATLAADSSRSQQDGAAPSVSPLEDQGPVYYGLTLATWIKIGLVAILGVAFYHVNLVRLWQKTNPINGQGNWEHAIVIPIVGIWYLYLNRKELMAPADKADAQARLVRPPADEWTLPGIWSLTLLIPLIALMMAVPLFLPDLLKGLFSFNPFLIKEQLFRLPLTLIVVGLFLYAVGSGALILYRGDELKRSFVQHWLTNVWRGMGAWLMFLLVAMGISFLLMVQPPPMIEPALGPARIALACVAVLCLGWIAWSGSSILWRRRYERIIAGSSGWFGTFVMVWGMLFSLWGLLLAHNPFFSESGMVVSLFGVVLLLTDWRVMKTAWFPIVYLLCAIPWPPIVYSWVALPLQNLAAEAGVATLRVTGVAADRDGVYIRFPDANGVMTGLTVEEACSGLKSLMTFISIAAAIAFLSKRLLWQRLVIVASAVPIAILCNTGRIAVQGLVHRYISTEWSQGFAHGFVGLLLLIPGFLLLMGVCWLVDHVLIEEPETEPSAKPRAGAEPVAATAGVAARVMDQGGSTAAVAADAGPAARPTPSVAAAPAAAKNVIRIPKRSAAASGAAPAAASNPATVPQSAAPAAPAAPTAKPDVAAPQAPAAAPRPAVAATAAPAVKTKPAPAVAATPATPSPATKTPAPAAPKAAGPVPAQRSTAAPAAKPVAGAPAQPKPAANSAAARPVARPPVAGNPVAAAAKPVAAPAPVVQNEEKRV